MASREMQITEVDSKIEKLEHKVMNDEIDGQKNRAAQKSVFLLLIAGRHLL